MDHVYVGLTQARPNCWLNVRCEGRKLSEKLSYSLLANAELSTKFLPNSLLIIILVSNLMNVIIGSYKFDCVCLEPHQLPWIYRKIRGGHTVDQIFTAKIYFSLPNNDEIKMQTLKNSQLTNKNKLILDRLV